MFEFAADYVAPDEEFGVRVRAEACAFFYAVFVYYAKRTERLVGGVVVGGEGEGVEGVKPAVISMTAGVPGTFDDFEGRGGGRHIARD